jgi:hypothetical protein
MDLATLIGLLGAFGIIIVSSDCWVPSVLSLLP